MGPTHVRYSMCFIETCVVKLIPSGDHTRTYFLLLDQSSWKNSNRVTLNETLNYSAGDIANTTRLGNLENDMRCSLGYTVTLKGILQCMRRLLRSCPFLFPLFFLSSLFPSPLSPHFTPAMVRVGLWSTWCILG